MHREYCSLPSARIVKLAASKFSAVPQKRIELWRSAVRTKMVRFVLKLNPGGASGIGSPVMEILRSFCIKIALGPVSFCC